MAGPLDDRKGPRPPPPLAPQPPRAPPPPALAEEADAAERRKQARWLLFAAGVALLLILAVAWMLLGAGGTGRGAGLGRPEGTGTGEAVGTGSGDAVEGSAGRGSEAGEAGASPDVAAAATTGEPTVSEDGRADPQEQGAPAVAAQDAQAEQEPSLVLLEKKTASSRPVGPSLDSGAGQAGRGAGLGDGAGGGGARPLGTGDVSFRIYWRPPIHDVDLHVIDPHGHHIFFRDRFCACGGQLDRDDRTSGGPENIFWPTGRGPRGTYTYLAHYYAGSGPKEVLIEVRKGEQIVDRKAFVLRYVGESSPSFTCTR